MNTSRLRRIGIALCAGLVLVAGCAKDTPQNVLKPEGPFARSPHEIIVPVFAVAGIVFLFVNGLVLAAYILFRRRSDDERPEQIHGNTKMEITWAIIPFAILAVMGAFTISRIFYLDKQHPEALQVQVIGHQWWWEYNYIDADGKVVAHTANELHIPVGRKVQLMMTSGDVIHSFWPPKLAGKIDVIPGRTNHMTIEAEKADFYYGQCGEYCGLSHANMRLRVVSQPQADFDRWLSANSAERASSTYPIVTAATSASATDVEKGYTLFLQKGCSGCHSVNGVSKGAVGPNLTYFNSRATFAGAIFENNDDNLRAWLRDPPAEKPGSLMPNLKLTEAEITQLTAYLRTLGDPSLRGTAPSGQAAGTPGAPTP
jgi:cytochrome c oxidase subunit 2